MSFPTRIGSATTSVTPAAASITAALQDGSHLAGLLVIGILAKDLGESPSWPAGWRQLADVQCGGGSAWLSVYYRIIDGSEGFDGVGDTIQIDFSPTNAEATARMITYETSRPPLCAVASGTGGGDVVNPPNLAVPVAEDYRWIAACNTNGNLFTGYPANYSLNQATHRPASGSYAYRVAERELNAASENPGTFTQSDGGADWAAVTLAIATTDARLIRPTMVV